MARIIAAFDSFKGSLTSREAGEAFRRGVLRVMPEADVRVLSIADGGEGMAEAVYDSIGGEIVTTTVSDPIGRAIEASYLIAANGTTAVVAMSAASGLTLLSPEELNPLITSTYGTGELILDAARRGCKHIIVGLGGSATNDGGSGMLHALGYRFYDTNNQELTSTIDILEHVAHISTKGRSYLLNGIHLTAAVDVDNPLYGECGAAHVFAHQKGADSSMIVRLDTALRHYAEVVDMDGAMVAGAGAAGGLGYALHSLLGAEIRSGIDVVLTLLDFDNVARDADIIVTGEGALDSQSLHGKAPMGVLRHAQQLGIPVIAIGGKVSNSEELTKAGFSRVYAITPEGQPLEEAMQCEVATKNIERLAAELFKGSVPLKS